MVLTKSQILLWICCCPLGKALVSGFISSGSRVPWRSRIGGFDGSATGTRSRRNFCFVLQATKTTSMEQLVFGCDYCYVSEPLPAGTTKEAAEAFLMKNSTLRDLLFGVGGTRPVTLLETTQELLDMWEEACEYFGCSERKPTAEDLMLGVEATVQFLGMKIITNSASGVFVMPHPKTGLKQYRSFSVGEDQRAEGLAPEVWLFNQLIGGGPSRKNKKIGQFLPPSGRAKSVISVVVDDNGTSGSVCFSFEVQLKVTVNFPSVLLKILPMTKDKMEEMGSFSIQKSIAKDVDAAVEATRKAFVEKAAMTVAAAAAQG